MGIVKLMILNDAMAVLTTRYDATLGQSEDKNQQRFFPKSKRQQYVHALAAAKIPDDALSVLRNQLSGTRTRTVDAFLAGYDLSTFNTTYLSRALPVAQKLANLELASKVHSKEASATELLRMKNLIFGVNAVLLHNSFTEISEAYTEQAGENKHRAAGGGGPGARGTVVSSIHFADVDPTVEPGAVYELRDREIPMGENDLTQIRAALDHVFRSSE